MLIETQSLCKRYGEKTAVLDLSISVKEGEIFGLLGPNGAGKSTLIKMLIGLVFKTSGEGQVLSLPLGDVKARKRMGYLPELFRYQEWMTGSDLLDFHTELYGLKKDKERNRRVLSRVGLLGQEKYKVGTYSKGMQQRIGLAAALLPDPTLLFLDEPTSALDPIGRKEVRDIILSLKAEGRTVFLNSHLLSEVETVSDSITIIRKGTVVKSGYISDLLRSKTMVLVTAENISDTLFSNIKDEFRAEILPAQNGFSLTVSERAELPKLSAMLVNGGARLFEIKAQTETLESVFLKVVGEEASA